MIVLGGILTIAALVFIGQGLRRHRWRKHFAVFAGAALVISLVPVGAASLASADEPDFAPMATDANPAFGLIPSDLEFILQQIEISEAHAYALETGDNSYSLLCQSNQDT